VIILVTNNFLFCRLVIIARNNFLSLKLVINEEYFCILKFKVEKCNQQRNKDLIRGTILLSKE